MRILAIESSCDETAAAVVEDGKKVLSSVIASQVEEHKLYGGVVPEIASRRHSEAILGVVKKALDDAGISLSQVDAIAATFAPGLIGALLVGTSFAKGLAMAANKPLIPVHHIAGHMAANYLAHPELAPPYLCLVASGSHSHIVEVCDYTKYRVLGKTHDDAAGECFDKAARVLGFPYPGGIHIDRAAKLGNAHAYELPKPKVASNPYDFSFSGLKTAVINIVHNAKQKNEEINKNDLAASFQRTVCEILSERTFLAAQNLGHKTIALAGGVSANSALREVFEKECQKRGMKLFLPPLELCGDNAAMIGCQAYYDFLAGKRADEGTNAFATFPLEESENFCKKF
ncbi:MAG: tRNA N6-adenosine threonylcarbamoyltransferase [Clostridiales bacterium]|jgi:N6-L-threonylcarbamoyladenine synthase|nr:gcp [Oscillospiraceae bacterium]MDN5378328.1 tRNA N6-adenosine threonylcarbamoyltransferase [Clostridiales bacterium]